MAQNLMLVIGGLALFLYGIEIMSASLKTAAGSRLKIIIEKTTNQVWKGILVGIGLSALIQSSSAVTVIIIGLVSVDLMTLKQATAVVIGANIGTTVTSILIGLPVAKWGLWFVAIGVLLFFIFSKKVPKHLGKSIVGLGLLFVGLEFLGNGVKDIAQASWAQNILTKFGDPAVPGFWLFGFGFSTAFTFIIQSSSAAVGVIQKLYDIDAITLIGAIPMVLGAKVGTTITGVLASLRGNRNSKRVALVHVFYNILATIIAMPFITPLSNLFGKIETNFLTPDTKMMTIALVHIFINIATMCIFVWIIKPVVKLVSIIIKDRKEDDELSQVLDEKLLLESPSIALKYAKSGIFMMSDLVYEHLQVIRQYQSENKTKLLERNEELEDKIDSYDQRLHKYIIDLVQKNELTESETKDFSAYLDIINNLERIGDHLHNIGQFIQQRHEYEIFTPEDAQEELKQFYDLIEEMMSNAFGALSKKDLKLALKVINSEVKADQYEKEFKHNHSMRLKDGVVQLDTQNNYHDILSNLERIADHLTNIAETIMVLYQPQTKKETVFGN
jgi:phosphate:Na+ symporter